MMSLKKTWTKVVTNLLHCLSKTITTLVDYTIILQSVSAPESHQKKNYVKNEL